MQSFSHIHNDMDSHHKRPSYHGHTFIHSFIYSFIYSCIYLSIVYKHVGLWGKRLSPALNNTNNIENKRIVSSKKIAATFNFYISQIVSSKKELQVTKTKKATCNSYIPENDSKTKSRFTISMIAFHFRR